MEMNEQKSKTKKSKLPIRTVGADLQGKKLKNEDMSDMDFTDADFSEAYLTSAILSNGKYTDANFESAHLDHAYMATSVFRGANFQYANLYTANLRGAQCQRANFSHALLAGADLSGANLTNANFLLADMRGAILKDADLQEIHFFPSIEHLTETSLRSYLNQYHYWYETDKNADQIKAAILADFLRKIGEMVATGRRDDALGCLYAADQHPYFSGQQKMTTTLFFKAGYCKEIDDCINQILAAKEKPKSSDSV